MDTNILYDEIKKIYGFLGDDLSKRIFCDRLLYSLTGDLQNIFRMVQYIPEAKEIIDQDSDIIIIDVRSEEEYQTGHIEGAVCIPNEVISDQIERLLSDKEQEILVYCRSGRRSSQAVDKLLDLGYTNVKDFGGIIDWPYKITK